MQHCQFMVIMTLLSFIFLGVGGVLRFWLHTCSEKIEEQQDRCFLSECCVFLTLTFCVGRKKKCLFASFTQSQRRKSTRLSFVKLQRLCRHKRKHYISVKITLVVINHQHIAVLKLKHLSSGYFKSRWPLTFVQPAAHNNSSMFSFVWLHKNKTHFPLKMSERLLHGVNLSPAASTPLSFLNLQNFVTRLPTWLRRVFQIHHRVCVTAQREGWWWGGDWLDWLLSMHSILRSLFPWMSTN